MKKKQKPHTKPGQQKAAAAARLKQFIEIYLTNNQNGTDAATKAGFSPRTAASQASRLLKNVKVQAILEARRAELLNRFELNSEAVLREIARIAYFDLGKCVEKTGELKQLHDIDEHTRRALTTYRAGTETSPPEVSARGKVEGLKVAMQYLRLLPHRGLHIHPSAQSAAAAEAAQLDPEKHSMLEIGRRIAFALVLTGDLAAKEQHPVKA